MVEGSVQGEEEGWQPEPGVGERRFNSVQASGNGEQQKPFSGTVHWSGEEVQALSLERTFVPSGSE